MSDIDDWLNIIRREAHAVAYHGQKKTTLVCTSYNPMLHAVKGILVPSMVESGWIGIATPQTNSGVGHFVGPVPGDSQKLDGDQFDVEFEFGDANTPIARARMSLPSSPPQVQSGEHLVIQPMGSGKMNQTLYAKDGSVTFTHFAVQGSETWAADGSLTTDTKGKTHTIMSSGGDIHIQSGGGTLHMND